MKNFGRRTRTVDSIHFGIAFHARCGIDGIAEQAVPWIACPYDIGHHGTGMKAYTNIHKSLGEIIQIDLYVIGSPNCLNSKLGDTFAMIVRLVLDEICLSRGKKQAEKIKVDY